MVSTQGYPYLHMEIKKEESVVHHRVFPDEERDKMPTEM